MLRRSVSTIALAGCLASGLFSAPAHAATAITLTAYTDFTNNNWSLGFEFSPTANIDVTALGSFFPTGVTDTHGVSLWTNGGGTLLATTTVAGNGTEGFQFAAITPVPLSAGVDYVVSATTLHDLYAGNPTFTVDADINYIQHQEIECAGVTPVCYPTTLRQGLDDFGANFQFAAVSAVPLPAALPLFATGLGALGLLGWRRKKKVQAAA